MQDAGACKPEGARACGCAMCKHLRMAVLDPKSERMHRLLQSRHARLQVDAGLEALDTAMGAGFEQFAKIRSDPNLETLRKSPKFKQVIDKYDEPVFNDNAIK